MEWLNDVGFGKSIGMHAGFLNAAAAVAFMLATWPDCSNLVPQKPD
jgi:hypothetical protein